MAKTEVLTNEQSTLLALIRSSLWGDPLPEQPETVMEAAKEQALVPLLFPDSSEAMQYSAHYIRILYGQDELVSLMQSAGIPMAILKGTAAAVYYPEPFRRTMGDLDFIVPQDRFQEASELMLKSGYELTQDLDDSPRHRCYEKNGIRFELHLRYSFEGIDVERYVIDGLKHPETASIEGHSFPILPPVENGMVLLSHAANHLREGLGFRQVIDWMMYVHRVLTDEVWDGGFRSAAASCGLETFAITMTRMCQMYLGLSDDLAWCRGADEQLALDLLAILLNTGNYGQSLGSGSRVEKVTTNIKRYGLFRYLQIAGEHNWKAYRRHRWLKPFCWFYQIFRYAKQGFRTGRNKEQLSGDLSRSQSRYELLRRLGIK